MPRVFDFDGALALARHLVATETQLGLLSARRTRARNEAFAQDNFIGPHADKAIARGESMDERVEVLLPEIVDRAWSWASHWAEAVNDTNQEIYEAEAERMKATNDAKREAYYRRVRSNPDGNHRYPEMGTVEPPRTAPVPVADEFQPEEPPFVSYVSEGVDRVANYSWG